MDYSTPTRDGAEELAHEFTTGGRSFGHVWRHRSSWQVRLRWWVPPSILVCVLAGRWVGFEFPAVQILLVGAAILAYNVVFAVAFARLQAKTLQSARLDRIYAIVQASLDYAAMFLLIHFTGGLASPLIFFLVFHVIFAGMLFRPSTAHLSAGIASVGMVFLAGADYLAWLPSYPLLFQGQVILFVDRPGHIAAILLFFTVSVFIVSMSTEIIMSRLWARVMALAVATEQASTLNRKLNSLYAMAQAVGTEKHLYPVVQTIASELAKVMEVVGVTVKLLSEDGKTLRYAAVFGLPPPFVEGRTVEVARSSLNRRVIQGETVVLGRVTDARDFQLYQDLMTAGIGSVLFARLTVGDRVIGILGAYCERPERFDKEDTRFFTLAAELVAIAIDNARHNEEVQKLMGERTRFMLQMAHNMRAPLGAVRSMLDVIEGGYLGEVQSKQAEHLRRVQHRLRNIDEMVTQLLILARTRGGETEMKRVDVDLSGIIEQIERAYRETAVGRNVGFQVAAASGLPRISGDPALIEQMLENLVSNAIKYTPPGGRVTVNITPGKGTVSIEVHDTGIGIPEGEQLRLFEEFFRASNARRLEETGTGLGLSIVKQTVERHGGRIRVQSKEGQGTTFIVDLPLTQPVG